MITLPDYPAPASAEPMFIDHGAIIAGPSDQRLERMGSRFGLSVSMPPMKGGKLGRQWISALVRAKQEGCRMEWPLQGFDPGVPGSPTVDGDDQSGRSLAITGAEPNYVVRDGQWLNHVNADGQHYLYMNVGETILDGSGAGTLAIEPMLRVTPDDGDQVKLSGVMIEGFLSPGDLPWSAGVAEFVGLAFELRESE